LKSIVAPRRAIYLAQSAGLNSFGRYAAGIPLTGELG
jgi:hypothetical protein